MRSTRFVVISLALVLSFVGIPQAKAVDDYCINLGPPIANGTKYVGKKLKLPKPGKCTAWQGYCVGCSPDNVQTGTACTASDGSHVSFQLTTAYLATNRQFDWVRLDLPEQRGNGNLNYLLAPGTTNYSATGAPCSPSPVPVP
jgi:hypothetical protein